MPGNKNDDRSIREAYAEGKLTEEKIRECAGRIIALAEKLNKTELSVYLQCHISSVSYISREEGFAVSRTWSQFYEKSVVVRRTNPNICLISALNELISLYCKDSRTLNLAVN